MSTEIVSIVLDNDGQLCQVVLPKGKQEFLLGMIACMFEGGEIVAVKLDETWVKRPLYEVNS